MLQHLYIRDFVIVDQAEISFGQGFTVFSGETGAGKSILIDALSLCLGGRTDTGLIREGANQTDISAVFMASGKLQEWLDDQTIDGPEVILRRVIDKQGRSKAYINGIPATLGQLKELGQQLVDIHGQHAHQSLLRSQSQREILDAQANLIGKTSLLSKIWNDWQKAQKNLISAKENAHYQQEQINRLQLDIDYLENINPQENEWQDLCTKQSRLAHSQALLSGTNQVMEILDGDDGSANNAINAAIQILRDISRHDQSLSELTESLESASIICNETASSIQNYISRLELDPDALAKYESRMSIMFEAARRFQTEPELLPITLNDMHIKLSGLQETIDLQGLEQKCIQLEQDYFELANKISKARIKAADQLANKVTASMQDMAMTGGQLQIDIRSGKPSAHGIDDIEFLVAGHTGVKPRALSKVASGGELARISLALSVIASQAARVPCLIFDEVDAGIGGAVAEVVGRLLQELGTRHQVLCVTHLPQVAAYANQHYQVSKTSTGNKTISAINQLDDNGRINEIARMLGGIKITDTTLNHAQEMLKNSVS